MIGKIFQGKKIQVHQNDKTPHCRVVDELLDPNGQVNDGAIQSWRIFRIMSEFVQGFETLRRHGLAATFFGSARTNPSDPYYRQAEELAGKLADKGFAVITGGGGGIMEAANAGAFNAGGRSVGINIDLPTEQRRNPYVNEGLHFEFFFSRKVMLSFAAEVYIYFPGGFGTLDEFFEIVTLVQTKKIQPIPVVLYGSDFWNPIVTLIKESLLKEHHFISPEDLDLFHVVDSVEEAYEYILENVDCNEIRQV